MKYVSLIISSYYGGNLSNGKSYLRPPQYDNNENEKNEFAEHNRVVEIREERKNIKSNGHI